MYIVFAVHINHVGIIHFYGFAIIEISDAKEQEIYIKLDKTIAEYNLILKEPFGD